MNIIVNDTHISIKDLMVGNYVIKSYYSRKDELIQVGPIDIYHGTKNLKPIKINKYWLVKLGFEENLDQHKFLQFTFGDYSVIMDRQKIFFVICNYMDLPPSVKIEFVHQLQNLYSSLTGGKQLEIIGE